MTPDDYRDLFLLTRKFQMHRAIPDSNLYRACDVLLDELWPHYHSQTKEQER